MLTWWWLIWTWAVIAVTAMICLVRIPGDGDE